MRSSTGSALILCVLLGTSATACRLGPASPPYLADQAPTAAALLELTRPRLASLQVAKAKIREGRSLSGTLMLAAQGSPARFAGSISAAGNELVSIALNEEEYALRWLRDDGLRAGFYTGPPSACAIERVLGVALSAHDLVALLLGGGPVIEDAQILEQRWQGKRSRRHEADHPGHEVLTLQNSREIQDVRFTWKEGRWWFAGTTMWQLRNGKRSWVWSIEHDDLRRVGKYMLPGVTSIRRPGPRGESVVSIAYLEQRPNAPGLSDTGAEGGDAGDTWNDDWDDEGDDGAEQPSESTPLPAVRPIPAVFRLDAAGLSRRGDLCHPD